MAIRPTPRQPGTLIGSLEHGLDRFTLTVATLGVMIFTVVVVYVALGRYLFGKVPYWSEELPRSLLVWTIFIGLVPATIRSSHLNAGLLPLLVKEGRVRSALVTLARLLTSLFFAILAWTGWQLTVAGSDSLTTALQIPNAVVYFALPIGCALCCVANLLPLLKGPSR